MEIEVEIEIKNLQVTGGGCTVLVPRLARTSFKAIGSPVTFNIDFHLGYTTY